MKPFLVLLAAFVATANASPPEKDREAILSMAGEYEVYFSFKETVALAEDYKLKGEYQEDATELVLVVEDSGDRIVLQHLLQLGSKKVVKHWKQIWTWQDRQIVEFQGNDHWKIREITADEAAGTWSQLVTQVDDSPRYESFAPWVHENGLSAWESQTTARPLPRREYTKRSDYEILQAINRHAITPRGWVHEQDNLKLVLAEDGQPSHYLAREHGVNYYDQTDKTDFSAARGYWETTHQFWKNVSDQWDQIMAERRDFAIAAELEGDPLWRSLFDLVKESPEAGDSKIEPILARYLGDDQQANWPAFRGNGNSTSNLADLPISWSDETLAWSADLAGYGQSSPVIWGEQVIVTSTGGTNKEQLFVESFDLKTGKEVWKQEFPASQTAAKVSKMISQGAPTPAVDEAGAYIFFESGDLVALDHEGKTRWVRSLTKEYGDFVGGHGVGSSLVMTPTVLVLLVDHEGPSYLLGIDKETGENVWKFDRDPRVSWTTPLYLEHDGVPQIVVSSNEELASFRLADGEKLWWVDGVKRNTVASPTTNGEVVVIGSSEPLNSLAIALGGKGDVTESHLKWRAESVTSSFGSPLVVDETVFFVNRAGALQATNLTDGSLQWERRLPASTWASPLATPSRLYFFANNGQTVVFDRENLDEEAPPLATNILTVGEEDKLYGYAVSTGQIVMRTGRKLMSANSNVAKTAQTAH